MQRWITSQAERGNVLLRTGPSKDPLEVHLRNISLGNEREIDFFICVSHIGKMMAPQATDLLTCRSLVREF